MQAVLPPNHPDIALSFYNLGISWNNKDDYDKANLYHNKTYTINPALHPANHQSNIKRSFNWVLSFFGWAEVFI